MGSHTQRTGARSRRWRWIAPAVVAVVLVTLVAVAASSSGSGHARAAGAVPEGAPAIADAGRASTTTATPSSAAAATTSTTEAAGTAPLTTGTTAAGGPVVTSLAATPSLVGCAGAPAPVALRWATRSATGVDLSVDGRSPFASYGAAGSAEVPVPCDGTAHHYTVTAKGAHGRTGARTVTVKAVPAATNPSAPQVHSAFVARKSPRCDGSVSSMIVDVEWTVRNAVRVHVDVEFSGGKDFAGRDGDAQFVIPCTSEAIAARTAHVFVYAVAADGSRSPTAEASVFVAP